MIESNHDNGCCYCIVDQSGERIFLAMHGAEYLFEAQWFDLLKDKHYDMIYVCGLELEKNREKYHRIFKNKKRTNLFCFEF